MRYAVYGCCSDNQVKGFSNDIKFFSFPKDNVLSRPSKSEFFFYSLIFTLNHRRPKMSKFDTSNKKFIETIFLNATSLSDADS
jgi:hypothetical protein